MNSQSVDAEKVIIAFCRLTWETEHALWRPRCIYADPEVLVVEDQETGHLWRIPFVVGWKHSIAFAEPQLVEQVRKAARK